MIETQNEFHPQSVMSVEEFVKIWTEKYANRIEYKECYQFGDTGRRKVVIRNKIVNGNILVSGNDILPDLELIDCELQNFEISNEQSLKTISFLGNTKVREIYLEGEANANNFIFADECVVRHFFLQSECSVDDIFIQNNAQVTGIFIYESSKVRSLQIKGNVRLGNIYLQDETNTGNIDIRGDAKIQSFTISSNARTGNLEILQNAIIGSLVFSSALIDNIVIRGNVKVHSLLLKYLETNCKMLTIEGCQIDVLKLKLNKPYQVTIKAYKKARASVHHLDFTGSIFSKDSYLHISDADVNRIDLDSFLNYGTIVLNNIKPVETFEQINPLKLTATQVYVGRFPSIFRLVNSDLGNTQFIACNLSAFTRFEFLNSKMADIFLADTQLPSRNGIKSPFELPNSENEQRRLALSQFKKVYENQGDVVRATQYRAEEMEVYRDQLMGDESNIFSENWWNNRSERLNLWLNMFSNYYGNNWLKAVVWTILLNSILFTFYCWAQGYWFGSNWQLFTTLAAYSFEFLNPLRKADFLEHITGKHPSAGAIALDYVSRIIIAYFVYQTISAFRKFGKRS